MLALSREKGLFIGIFTLAWLLLYCSSGPGEGMGELPFLVLHASAPDLSQKSGDTLWENWQRKKRSALMN